MSPLLSRTSPPLLPHPQVDELERVDRVAGKIRWQRSRRWRRRLYVEVRRPSDLGAQAAEYSIGDGGDASGRQWEHPAQNLTPEQIAERFRKTWMAEWRARAGPPPPSRVLSRPESPTSPVELSVGTAGEDAHWASTVRSAKELLRCFIGPNNTLRFDMRSARALQWLPIVAARASLAGRAEEGRSDI